MMDDFHFVFATGTSTAVVRVKKCMLPMLSTNVGSSIIEDSLLSMEELDRTSPELWPEQIPGVSEYLVNTTSFGKGQSWMKGLDNDDKAFLIYLSKLTPSGLVSEVKKLYDTAYQLGCEESKEMTRGKYLKVLLKNPNSNSNSV